MSYLTFLILFPFAVAIVLMFMGKDSALRTAVVACGGVAEIAGAIAFAYIHAVALAPPVSYDYLSHTGLQDKVIAICETLLMVLVFSQAIRFKKYYVMFLSALGTIPVLWLDVAGLGESTSPHIHVDTFTIIMVLVVGIVGSLICIYAAGYIKDYHHHHTDIKDRSGYFLAMLFVFMGAMMGLISSDNLSWMYFFWEITSVCSFLLIGYSQTDEAVTNSFRALWMNLLGGCGFMAAIMFCVLIAETYNLSDLLKFYKIPGIMVFPVAMLAFAALTKSAQMPFSGWLLGAMVAPTPTSALLHSATMVKAGVYLLLRLSPMMYGTLPGIMVTAVGGFTFFAASLLAISVSDGKKVLAYSTISNLGLITAAAGCGVRSAVWAGIMLLIFHAVTKSAMFMSVGAYENSTGSRDVEDMHGMIVRVPKLAFVMTIGIFGMSVVPLGMCVAKWAALRGFIDSGNVYLILFLCFGSASTLFYWIKWLGKIFIVSKDSTKQEDKVRKTEWVAIYPLTALAVLLCFIYPVISSKVLVPYINDDMFGMQGEMFETAITTGDFIIMGIMIVCMCLLPIAMRIVNKKQDRKVLSYMSGFNTGDDRSFYDSKGERQQQHLSNWYLQDIFGEKKLLVPCLVISAAFVIVMMSVSAAGGLFI
ncbi:MAG: NADH-quinone oxidoreductase subunit L [Lachnospiraceae bacterium]|nr:NADH-quinone oxidoreductase subunit L [Lachnospiraceae bacterium]